jgi:hypothetical protein
MREILTLLKELREEWPTAKAARWLIFLGVVLGVLVGFGISTLWWTGTVGTLRERLAFSQDRLQIALANPSNPAALLTKEPGRHLTDSDKKCLVENFKDLNDLFKAMIVTAFPDEEPQKYASEFAILFVRMGYKSGVLPGNPRRYEDIGVLVGLKDPNNPSSKAKQFIELMKKCNITNQEPIRYEAALNLLPEAAALDFDLFVGPRE